MKNVLTTTFLIIACCITFSSHAEEKRWKDQETGAQFLWIGGSYTFGEAYTECRNRGWDMFNYEYLSKEAKKRIANDLMENIHWEERHPGQPASHQRAEVWMSSQVTPIAVNPSTSYSYALLRDYESEPELKVDVKFASREEHKQLVCMYLSHEWIGCSHELKCTFESSSGFAHIRYGIYEYGETKSVAMDRIKKRAKKLEITGARCDMAIKDPLCLNYRLFQNN